jgi:SAM-dependent methyltransferase
MTVAPSRVSFRDPAGSVWRAEHQILRRVDPAWTATLESFLATLVAKSWQDAGKLVRTEALDAATYVHPAVFFPSYPAEWCDGMLVRAAALTLELAAALLPGWQLKDATPYNVLFQGTRPIFVDVLSPAPRDRENPLWLAAAQFDRMFLLPRSVARATEQGVHRIFMAHPDGLTPEDAWRMVPWWRRFTTALLTLSTIPNWLGKIARPAANPPRMPAERAHQVLALLLARRARALAGAVSAGGAWVKYPCDRAKLALVASMLAAERNGDVLDLGCNHGEFALAATAAAHRVVAVDRDAAVIERLFRRASATGADVLPLVVDITAPTPASGWMNRERRSFLDRAAGSFDAVLALALLHHLLAESIPLDEIIGLLATLTRGWVLLEYVPPDDPGLLAVARGRPIAVPVPKFEATVNRFFRIDARVPIGNRTLYRLSK